MARKYTMARIGTKNGLLFYWFHGGPYNGTMQARTQEEALEGFKKWLPEKGVTVRALR